jgi:hypothetical protein
LCWASITRLKRKPCLRHNLYTAQLTGCIRISYIDLCFLFFFLIVFNCP